MTVYTVIPSGDRDPESPVTPELIDGLYNNPAAIAEGDATAPDILTKAISGSYPVNHAYFGSGSDGSLTISSSTTHAKGEYHYTDFTLNSGQTLGCTSSSDAHLIIRCTGTCTIAGTIDLDGDGADGGAGTTGSAAGAGGDASFGGAGGSGGCDGAATGRGGHIYNTNTSISGGASRTSATQDGEAGDAVSSNSRLELALLHKMYISDSYTTGGAGGGGGTGASVAGGDGGQGGGVIIIIADTIDFQAGAIITADGTAGGYSANDGGGGGGGGGAVILIGKTITNNGTITVTGGAAGGSGVGITGGAGGAGYSNVITLS